MIVALAGAWMVVSIPWFDSSPAVWLDFTAAGGIAAVAISGPAMRKVRVARAICPFRWSEGSEIGRPRGVLGPVNNALQRVSPRLVDDAIEAHVDWREECVSVRTSYDRWASSNGTESGNAFVAYRAALEREERASHVYAECVARVAQSHNQQG